MQLAGHRFAAGAAVVTLGTPLLAFLSGLESLLFFVHVALEAFWFGFELFVKFVLGPALTATPESVGVVNRHLVPKMVVELSAPGPDGERLGQLFGEAMQWGLLQTVLMLVIVVMTVGLRGLL